MCSSSTRIVSFVVSVVYACGSDVFFFFVFVFFCSFLSSFPSYLAALFTAAGRKVIIASFFLAYKNVFIS